MAHEIIIGKAQITEINEHVRVSVVKWSETEYNCITIFNSFPRLYPQWKSNEVSMYNEQTLSSSMQVYRYIEDTRFEENFD